MSVDRIRYLARNALNGFDTLDLETAAEMARADLADLLAELDRADVANDAVTIPPVLTVE